VRNITAESQRAALVAEQRTLFEEHEMLRRTPWDIKARRAFVARLTNYERRFRAFLRRLPQPG
jgi:hypothetical protein